VGDEGPLSLQPRLTPFGKNLHPDMEVLREEGTKKEIVIPFEILNMDATAKENLESFENGKIFSKGKRPFL
jgi:hypothetical protein